MLGVCGGVRAKVLEVFVYKRYDVVWVLVAVWRVARLCYVETVGDHVEECLLERYACIAEHEGGVVALGTHG